MPLAGTDDICAVATALKQAAEKVLYQGTTLQASEKLSTKGTASVVP
jgi:hypothetical protein